MKRFYAFGIATVTLLLVVVSAVFAATTMPPQDGAAQEGALPTATYLPVGDDFTYTVEQVSMADAPILFDDQEVDGFSFTDFSYVTRYPAGLDFTATITPPEDVEIVSINLIYRFPAGTQGRVQAEPTANENEWNAVAFDTRGLPPWMTMDVFWRVAYGETGVAESDPVTVQYIDPTREWWRVESEDVIVYWFDFPQEMGEVLVTAFYNVRERYIRTFGDVLPFKPTVVIFPPGDAMGEWRPGGQINPRTTGMASSDTYSATLRVRGLEIEEIRQDCIWNEERDLEWQMRYTASVATHEVAHLYQYAFFGGRGPTWWIEGQATFLELEMGPVDQRLRYLAELGEDMPTLQGSGPSGMVGTPAIDGCTHLGYEIGASFINWLVNTQGGYETLGEIVQILSTGIGIDEAIEMATGVPFLELERQWRTYIGVAAEPYIRPTEPFRFPPTVTPFGQ
ncbi:MAG: hypothetical protein GYB66_05645 [Chloroflexi bacterium]|nr:hypothetical protein [Chloroflexota bacterium]